MDIIAAHQQGLTEQLEEEVAAITGQPRDHAQRAMVLHHLYDHSRGAHHWALAEARRELRIAAGLEALAKRIGRWGWMHPRGDEARLALAQLAEALGEQSKARCAAGYLAYRLSATAALGGEAERRLPPELLELLSQCHRARRSGERMSGEPIAALAGHSELSAADAVDDMPIAAAWAAIGATWLARAAARLLSAKALERGDARDRRLGWHKVEQELLSNPRLPASFRANPAQHFYALQLGLAQRRRQRWREACDREPDSFELAA